VVQAQAALLLLNVFGAAMLGIGFLFTLPISAVAASRLAADLAVGRAELPARLGSA
jgi:hypothetical protein